MPVTLFRAMLFNSFAFAVFFPLVAAAYFLLPQRWRWALLLVASYWFYMYWKAEYALLLVLSTVVDYFAALGIARASELRIRKRWLWVSMVTNLGILIGFKYFNFLNDSARALTAGLGGTWPVPDLDVLLPMGISFYTFQTMSYTIDVYRGHMEPTRHPGRFALYVSFFPQLVAGPIERARSLLPQFERIDRPDHERIVAGLKQMLWGFFKKVVIADRAAMIVDAVYNNPGAHDGATLLLATLMFSVQAYGDFSGYSDIAIGAARVLGFDLMVNFRTPFLSTSIREFWQRWHISLMTWFRDYIYIPLGGRRGTTEQWYRNIMVVFLVSGLWHGAAWTYVLFGALHGVYVLAAIALRPAAAAIDRTIGWKEKARVRVLVNGLITFALVNISWFLFRANDLDDAVLVATKVFSWSGDGMGMLRMFDGIGMGRVLATLALIVAFAVIDPFMDGLVKGERFLSGRGNRILLFAALLAALVLFGYYGEVQFIYFQF